VEALQEKRVSDGYLRMNGDADMKIQAGTHGGYGISIDKELKQSFETYSEQVC
jgi:hypothetical protein